MRARLGGGRKKREGLRGERPNKGREEGKKGRKEEVTENGGGGGRGMGRGSRQVVVTANSHLGTPFTPADEPPTCREGGKKQNINIMSRNYSPAPA